MWGVCSGLEEAFLVGADARRELLSPGPPVARVHKKGLQFAAPVAGAAARGWDTFPSSRWARCWCASALHARRGMAHVDGGWEGWQAAVTARWAWCGSAAADCTLAWSFVSVMHFRLSGWAARDLREAGAREAEAEMLAGGCGGHQTCRGRPVGVPEGPVPNGAIFHSSLMIRPPPGPASPLPLPSPLPPTHMHFSLPPPRPPLPLPFPHALPLMPYSRLKHDEGTD